MENPLPTTEQMSTIVERLIPEGLKLLEEIVNINSYSENVEGNNLVQDVLQREFLALGLHIERVPCIQCGDILIARTAASHSQDILLLGHSDTVFPPTSLFQKMTYGEDRLMGPGVSDMKGGIISILLGLKALKEIGELDLHPLRIIINTDEETGSVHSKETFGEQARDIKTALVFEPGRVGDLIVTSRVGSRSFQLTVQGKSAHSGNAFTKGANAITRIAYIVNELRKLTDMERGLTCNVGILNGGEAVNVVPNLAEGRFELRAEEKNVLDEATDKAMKIIQHEEIPGTQASVKVIYTSLPFERTSAIQNLFNQYQLAAQRVGLNIVTNEVPIRGGSDANFFAGKGIPTLDALGPFGEGYHSSSEFMSIHSLSEKTLSWLYWLLEKRED